MKKFLSVLYAPDGCTSLPRLVFFSDYIAFLISVFSPVSADKCTILLSSLAITGASFLGNKYVAKETYNS